MSGQFDFRQDDDMSMRAYKIWRALGFVNDRIGAIPSIAQFLATYRELDDRERDQAERKATP